MSRGRYTCAANPAPLESDPWTPSCAPIWTICAPSCAEIRHSADEVRTELRQEIQRTADALRTELSAKIEGTAETLRRHFGVVTEGLRWELRAVAEGTLGNTAAIERLEAEMNRRCVSAEAVQRAALDDFQEQLVDVRRDLAELRAGR